MFYQLHFGGSVIKSDIFILWPISIDFRAAIPMMLRHINKMAEADKLEAAVAAVIAEGKDVTYDMKPDRNDPTAVGTSQMADAIIEKMK